MKAGTTSRTFIGIGGYDYKPWRGRFYPDELPARRWLEFASRRFDSAELDGWAEKVTRWRDDPAGGRDVYVYFDNDIRVHAPFDAMRLAERVGAAVGHTLR